jgi:hypothetical protein
LFTFCCWLLSVSEIGPVRFQKKQEPISSLICVYMYTILLLIDTRCCLNLLRLLLCCFLPDTLQFCKQNLLCFFAVLLCFMFFVFHDLRNAFRTVRISQVELWICIEICWIIQKNTNELLYTWGSFTINRRVPL